MNRFFFTQQGTLRFRARIALAFTFIGILVSIVASISLYNSARIQIIKQIQQRAITIASLTAIQQNGDLHSTLTEQDSSTYNSVRNRNTIIMNTDKEITSIYTMRRDETGNIYFVVDVVNDSLSVLRGPAKLGEFYIDASEVLQNNFGTINSTIVESQPYTDSWGTTLSAYAPFYRSNGEIEGIVGVDISANVIETAQQEIIATSFYLILGLIPLTGIAGWILGTVTATPIEKIAESAQKIINGDFSQTVQVHSRDDIGLLATTFNKMTDQLRGLISNLESRVSERTVELTAQTQELQTLAKQEERRASQFQTIAQVSSIINTVQSTEELLPRITNIISDQFGYYHTGIFLISADGRYAVLSATNSPGGKKMLARNHRLKVGAAGIVGFVTGTGVPRIALDVGDDAVFFDNPDLPDTRSEAAVPLRAGKQIIGALDVQSETSAAFSPADVELLSILADQVTIAIENSRLFEQTRKSLADAQNVYRQYLKTQWTEFLKDEKKTGYRYALTKTYAIDQAVDSPQTQQAKVSGKTQFIKDEKFPQIIIPIKLRDEVVGVLNITSQTNREWTEDELDIAQAVAERVAIASETARLLSETQRKAAKEETIGQITSKISSSVNMHNILQTTVEEIGRAIPGSEIVIQLRGQDN